jgi:hypothetical protein
LYCTKGGWRCIGHFSPALVLNLHNPPTNGGQGPIPEEMSQTLLARKQEARKPVLSKLVLTARNTLFALQNQ